MHHCATFPKALLCLSHSVNWSHGQIRHLLTPRVRYIRYYTLSGIPLYHFHLSSSTLQPTARTQCAICNINQQIKCVSTKSVYKLSVTTNATDFRVTIILESDNVISVHSIFITDIYKQKTNKKQKNKYDCQTRNT